MKKLITTPEHFKLFAQKNFNQQEYFFDTDPPRGKVGSGGGTVNLLYNAYQNSDNDLSFNDWLADEKRLMIHAGGQSKRLPAYAAVGKILTPIPVFKWQQGQRINQTLLDLQLPIYEQILNKSPDRLNTLIASGDVLIRNDGPVPSIPNVDVVCFGLWERTEKVTNHGVFFADKSTPDQLSFVLQKPSQATIEKLNEKYNFLIDIGVWLLSPRAIKILFEKCGWENDGFKNKTPGFYDLYTTFGESLGKNPTLIDEETNSLSVAIIPLNNGEFYHFGTTAELVESTSKLQLLQKDQRKIWHNKVKPNADLYTQNSITKIEFKESNKFIWIENSYIGNNWQLNNRHCITGIPQNEWGVNLSEGLCIDFIPIGEDNDYAIRIYSYNYPQRPLRGIHAPASSTPDWYTEAAYPVFSLPDISSEIIQHLIDNPYDLTALKNVKDVISAEDIPKIINLERQFAQRKNFLANTLPAVARNWQKSVFHQLDLRHTANIYADAALPLPEELNSDAPLFSKLKDNMFRSEVLNKKNIQNEEAKNYEAKSFEILRETILDTARSQLVEPQLNVMSDQIIWGRSPIRLDLAGGWTDTPPYCLVNGGNVVNIAVELNGQPPLQVFVKPNEEYHISIRSIDLGVMENIYSYEELNNYNTIGSAFSIPKAALCLAGFSPEYSKVKYKNLQDQLKDFGSGIEISLLAAIPKGSGLGTSSILASTVLGTLNDFCSLQWDKYTICNRTLILEQMLTSGGGWQDQYGGIFQGIKLLQSAPAIFQQPTVLWAPDHIFTDANSATILLYYTGITRVAKNILAEIVKGMFLNDKKSLEILTEMKQHALNTFHSLQSNNLQEVGEAIAYTWELNQKLDSGTNTTETQSIIDKVKDYLIGCKLLGAGGGGYLLMYAKDINAALKIRNVLEKKPINKRARFVDWQISKTGFQVTKS